VTGISALEYLAEQRKIPVIMLQNSYRCQNPRLLRFASTLFYDAVVKTSVRAEYYRLPYHERERRYPRSTMRLYSTSSLPETVRTEQLCFDGRKPGLANRSEALVCAEIFYEASKKYPLNEISIIAPYRKQVSLIQDILSLEHLNYLLKNKNISYGQWNDFLFSRVATVDSFQGGESDVVIICYVRSNKDDGIGFIDNPNRINVAHTRCRREMHIIGDIECLKRQSKGEIFDRLERAFRRDGEIIEITKLPRDITIHQ
jgi:superfamily I DNA and/or RNA helicase